jgi:pyruvate/2-oxoglutarate dehydrogenase complex dihydrolipoamide acyltransferase (E2) component
MTDVATNRTNTCFVSSPLRAEEVRFVCDAKSVHWTTAPKYRHWATSKSSAIALTVDHRALDGAFVARLLNRMAEILNSRDWESDLT